jgi:hypothetical protein
MIFKPPVGDHNSKERTPCLRAVDGARKYTHILAAGSNTPAPLTIRRTQDY